MTAENINQIRIASSAAIADGVVYFGCRDGHFHAVDANSGKLRWSHDNKMGWVIASPAVKDGVVYFPTSDGTRFKALDAATGALRYGTITSEFQSDGSRQNAAQYTDDKGRLNGRTLYTEQTLDGTIIGLHRMLTLGSFLSSPVLAGGVLYIGSTDGNLYALGRLR
jgi:eukaryotic-like serine/threonine-protein kinase